MKQMQKAFFIACLLFCSQLHALSVMDIQGVMLQRISSFITWPTLPELAMRVCIVGDETFVANLQQLYLNKKLHGLPIEVMSVDTASSPAKLAACQIIFFADKKSSSISSIAESTKSEDLLIVSANAQGINKGATVALYPDNNKFKIIINKNSLQSRKLKADYRLMKLAEVVESPEINHATE